MLERRMAENPALAAEHARFVALQAAVAGLPRPDVSEAFRNRMAALGTQQAARRPAPRSFDWRAIAASILVTAVLASSTTYWATIRTGPDEITILSDDIGYAGAQNYGFEDIPSRRFLGLSRDNVSEIESMAVRWLAGVTA
jgi:hypothetical protein